MLLSKALWVKIVLLSKTSTLVVSPCGNDRVSQYNLYDAAPVTLSQLMLFLLTLGPSFTSRIQFQGLLFNS